MAALTAENITAHLQPPATAVGHLPAVTLSDQGAQTLFLGQTIPRDPAAPDGDRVAASTADGVFVGILRPEGRFGGRTNCFPRNPAENGSSPVLQPLVLVQ
jgi:hypothetical protein